MTRNLKNLLALCLTLVAAGASPWTAAAVQVSITSPATGTRYLAPATVPLVASATDSGVGRSIVKVEFFQGTTLIGAATSAPWSLTWAQVPIGSYRITARATDNAGQSATSAAIAVHVRKNAAPTVKIIDPKSNTKFFSPATFAITAKAQDKDDPIARVDFYQGTTLLGTAASDPYTITWSNVPQGDYSLTAVATDDLGASKTSAKVVVHVRDNVPPKVRISAPADNKNYVAPATIPITIKASDTDDPVGPVQIYSDGALLATLTAAPYTFTWTPVWPGDYALSAKATDSLGASTMSAPITVHVKVNPANVPPTVTLTSPANNAVFLAPADVALAATANDPDDPIAKVDFYRDATLVGTAASAPYSATVPGLAFGHYIFTAVATDMQGAATTSSPVSVIINAPPSVSITAPASGTVTLAPGSTTVTAAASDLDGTVARVDFYRDATLIGTSFSAPYTASLTNLAYGTYVLTAVATDDRGASTTSAPVTFIVNSPPSVSVTAPADNTVVTAPGVIALAANASDLDGTIAKVEFFQGTTSIGIANTAPYTASVSGLAAGSYVFTAVATDDRGAATTSSPIHAIVNAPPSVSLTSPANNSIATAPANLTLAASAADADGTIAKVEFYQKATLVGTATTPPFTASVASLAAGTYFFTARATDDRGASTTSAPVKVTVSAPAGPVPGNVVQYTYDAVGNITKVERQLTGGLAVASFDPPSAPVGSTVTIYGSGFDASAANDLVKFNGTPAVVGAAAAGALSVTVPVGATSGRITVAVGSGSATSPRDFVVSIAGAPSIASFTPSSGAPGTTVTVTGTSFDTAANATTVKLNAVAATASVASSTSLTFVVPAGAGSGRITATTSVATAASAQDFVVPPAGVDPSNLITLRLTTGGSAASLSVPTATKSAMILFDASAAGYYSMQFSHIALSPSNAGVPYRILKPDGTQLASGSVGDYGSNLPTIHLPRLASAGTYAVLLGPGTATLNASVSVAADPIVAIDGAAVSVALDSPSQSARFAFDAGANQHIGIGTTGTTVVPGNYYTFQAFFPDGSPLTLYGSAQCFTTFMTCGTQMTTLAAGTYTLIVGPSYSNQLAATTILLSSDVTGSLAPDVPQNVTLARAGQDARFTFSAAVGDSLAVDLAAINPQPPQVQTFYAFVYQPDGTYLTQCSAQPPAAAYCDLSPITVSGTYSVAVYAGFGASGTMKLILKQGPTLQTTDAPAAFAPPSVSEAARFRFAGTAGQNLSVAVTGLSLFGANVPYAALNIHRPDGTLVGGATCLATGAGCKETLASLPSTGTYAVDIQPPGGGTITGNINLSADVTGALAPGVAQAISATRAGQNARFTFSGTAGDSTSIKLIGVATTPASQSINLTIYAPNGGYYASGYSSSGSAAFVNVASLPASGTYTVVLEPAYAIAWQAQLVLDPGVALTVDGPTASLSKSTAGEPLRFTFTGTAGQRVELGIAGLAYASASAGTTTLDVFGPSGANVVSAYPYCSTSASCRAIAASLPAAGTYSVVVTPPVASAITAGTLAISTPLAGTLVIGDPAQTVAITRPGQSARYTFSAASGQLLRLNWSGASVSNAYNVNVTVLNPDGSTLSSGAFANGASGGIDIAALPAAGTYTVIFDPTFGATMSAPVTLVTR